MASTVPVILVSGDSSFRTSYRLNEMSNILCRKDNFCFQSYMIVYDVIIITCQQSITSDCSARPNCCLNLLISFFSSISDLFPTALECKLDVLLIAKVTFGQTAEFKLYSRLTVLLGISAV